MTTPLPNDVVEATSCLMCNEVHDLTQRMRMDRPACGRCAAQLAQVLTGTGRDSLCSCVCPTAQNIHLHAVSILPHQPSLSSSYPGSGCPFLLSVWHMWGCENICGHLWLVDNPLPLVVDFFISTQPGPHIQGFWAVWGLKPAWNGSKISLKTTSLNTSWG